MKVVENFQLLLSLAFSLRFCWCVHISIAWHSCTADYLTLCSGSQSGLIELIPLFHTDINECIEYEDYENPYTTNDVQVEHNHLCHAKATCFNTIGSFHCKCKLGYHGDGKLCLSNKYRMVAALFRSKWQRVRGFMRNGNRIGAPQVFGQSPSKVILKTRKLFYLSGASVWFRSRKAFWIRKEVNYVT